MHSLLRQHRAVVVLFTDPTCPPSKDMESVFEEIASEKARGPNADQMAFVIIDVHVGMGRQIGAEWNIWATPTFFFFLDGNKVTCAAGVMHLGVLIVDT